MTSVSVLVVDDHAIWRGGVRSMLQDTEFVVVAEASTADEALRAAVEKQPRIALVDVRMAGGDGFEVLRMLRSTVPNAAVIMLTTYESPTYIGRAVAGGASGYLNKGIERDELVAALRSIAHGRTLLSTAELVASIREAASHFNVSGDLVEPLTARETEVLQLVAAGLPNRDIGAILGIGEGTVKTHVEHIIGKIGVADRVQVAVWAAMRGIAPGLPTE